MKIVVVGCAHGMLDQIYDSIQFMASKENLSIDLVLCCGDFQAVRNPADLHSLAVKPFYRQLNSFYKYYSGEKVAPYLTLFIGGNHEASAHLAELPYGGWVAPNIYYLGLSNVVQFGPLRIAGLSGIFKDHDYYKPRYERPPFDENSLRSVYHVRHTEITKLSKLAPDSIDIFLTHDWPQGVITHGNTQRLFRIKPFLRNEQATLGNPGASTLLTSLRPTFWFAAHMHVKYAAIVPHSNVNSIENFHATTKFLALDKYPDEKCADRDFMQVIDIPTPTQDSGVSETPFRLCYDEEWLAILRSLHGKSRAQVGTALSENEIIAKEREWVRARLAARGGSELPANFVRTAPALVTQPAPLPPIEPFKNGMNPQTAEFLELFELDDVYPAVPQPRSGVSVSMPSMPAQMAASPLPTPLETAKNPEEISLGEDLEGL